MALGASALITGLWSYALLHRASGWHPWVAVLVVLASAEPAARGGSGGFLGNRPGGAGGGAGPAAWHRTAGGQSVSSALRPDQGHLVTATR